MKTGIIIPCYNEENRLNQEAFVRFIKENKDYHLCFVNDGSKDMTLEVLHKVKRQSPNEISIVDVKRNAGKAAAVRAGVRYLYSREDISYFGFIDADLSTDFRDFKDLVKTLKSDQKLSVVFGSRNSGGQNIKRDFFRNMFSQIVKSFVLLILGLPIRDTQCGAKVFSRSIVPVVYNDAFISKWLFDVEIFLRLKRYLGKQNVMTHILEQPLMRWEHVEDSKLGLKDSLEIPLRLLHIWFNYTADAKRSLVTSGPKVVPMFELQETPQIAIAA